MLADTSGRQNRIDAFLDDRESAGDAKNRRDIGDLGPGEHRTFRSRDRYAPEPGIGHSGNADGGEERSEGWSKLHVDRL